MDYLTWVNSISDMRTFLQFVLLILALFTGIFPAGSCVRVALDPCSGCCADETLPKQSNNSEEPNEFDHKCPLNPFSEKTPCCFYMPGDFACAESTPLVSPSVGELLLPSMPFVQLVEANGTQSFLAAIALRDPPPIPIFLTKHCLLV
jgi:hypothetical protein